MQIAAAETESVRVFRQAGMDVVRPTKTWTVARGALRFQVENGPLKRLVHTSENRTATLPACLRMALALRTFPRYVSTAATPLASSTLLVWMVANVISQVQHYW